MFRSRPEFCRSTRRGFLAQSLLAAASGAVTMHLAAHAAEKSSSATATRPDIVDCNVHLFEWPFRRLKYDRTEALVAKLRRHHISQAWAGTFEAVLHKQLDGANGRLFEECQKHREMLTPFGSVNPAWPDWEEDLRRCHEQYHMPGIRLYPAYHGYMLDHPEFARMLSIAAQRRLLVQIAIRLEDNRVHHGATQIADVNTAPLAEVLKKVPEAKVQLINSAGMLLGNSLPALVRDTQVTFDIAAIEGNGGVGRALQGKNSTYRSAIPIERLMFGSHAPFFPCESALLKLFESPLSLNQLHRLMHANAKDLISAAHQAKPNEYSLDIPGTREVAIHPADYGLPTRDELVSLRIWDMHYHGFLGGGLSQHLENLFYVERMGIERMLSLDVAGSPTDPLGSNLSDAQKKELREYLETNSDRIVGLIPIDPSQPVESCRKIEEWIRNGPCVGIKYYGGNPGGVVCSHPNNDAIIRLAAEQNALIYIHTWMKIGGDPRRPGGDNLAGESTPMNVALLAQRFPDVPLICGHSGGDWELGVQAVRRNKNVYIEFSGSDPHSGQVDYTVQQIGIDRLIWGGHGPSRSYSTELSKVLDADLTHDQRLQVFGGNLRKIAGPIFRKKDYKT